ncbi:hypothetical protein GALL_305080 [mine drainage metagenome]|jgi:hypothetical protein|uniref:Uncharacterized protein n=1 Tax=mine drainage metagenome TaxID=410659 RepID=A0A1J5RHN7_9ZZZZ
MYRRLAVLAAAGLLACAQVRAAEETVIPTYPMKSGPMRCSDHQSMDIEHVAADSLELIWKGRRYRLDRDPTSTGAYHYDDRKVGLVMIQIPAKSMLFDNRNMTRLADDCNPVVASR